MRLTLERYDQAEQRPQDKPRFADDTKRQYERGYSIGTEVKIVSTGRIFVDTRAKYKNVTEYQRNFNSDGNLSSMLREDLNVS